MANQIWRNTNTQSYYQENQETSEEVRPLKGYKKYNQNVQTQQTFVNSQEENLPLKCYKQQYQNEQVCLNQQEQDLPLKGYKQQFKNNEVCLNPQEEDLPLRGYKQYNNKKPQQDKTYYYQYEQIPIQQANQELSQHQQQNYDNQDQGCQQQYFRSNSDVQNRGQYHHRGNQRRGYFNKQYNQANQDDNKNNFRQQIPQQYKNICYQFQTQFLRANNYYDINELRANFKALRELNKNHQPSQNSHFVLIRPKNGFQNIHKAIKYGVWCSTSSVNQELSQLYYEKDKSVYLIFFPLGSTSKLIGIAQMISDYDPNQSYKYWDNDGIYKGSFELIWHSIKNVDPEYIQQIPYIFGRGEVKYYNIDQFRDGTQISYYDALQIFEIFNQAPEIPSVFEHFNVLDIQEDQKRSNKLKNQEKEEFQLKQQGLKKKYQY